VIVRITVIGLKNIVIDVLTRKFDFNAIELHRFQGQHGQRAERILHQELIYFELDFLAGRHVIADQVGFEDFMCDVLGFVSQ
jgi:hypothetical protein